MDGDHWDEIESWPWPEVQAWQLQQLAPWLEELPGRSDHYRARLGSTPAVPRDLAALAGLPTTTKDELRAAQADAPPGAPFGTNQAAPLVDIVQLVTSSGTTGDPTLFGLTGRDLATWQQRMATAFYTAGVRPTDVVAHLVALPGVAGGMPYAEGLRTVGATLAWLGGLPPERVIRAIPRVQATTVLATSSFGTYLADRCRDVVGRDATTLGVRNLLAGGEPGLGQPEIRAKIRDGWGLDHVHEIMGLGDVMPVAWAECDDEGGMHFTAQRSVLVELVDPGSGEHVPWEPGARGEAVYTTFDREASPVLRYRSADHLEVTAAHCPCGRTSPRVRCVGRTDDMLIYKAMNVFPSAIQDVILERLPERVQPYLRIWKESADQVRFDGPIPLEIEAAESLPPAEYAPTAEMVEHEVRQRLQVRVSATVIEPGTLPRSTYKNSLVQVR